MTDSLRIGRIIEVHGSRAVGELEASVRDLYRTHRSRKYAIGQVGSIVKVEASDMLVFGVVTSLRMAEAPAGGPTPGSARPEGPSKWIEIELLGEGRMTGVGEAQFEFERGVSAYPLPGQPISLATVEELKRIYTKPDTATIQVGTVSQARTLPVHLMLDPFLGRHFAILGTTGAGKSCSVALLLQSIVRDFPHGHIVLLDPHNEYSSAFPDVSERVDPTTMEIPHWLLNFEELIEVFVGRSEHAATSQTNILKQAVIESRRSYPGIPIPAESVTVDTPVPFRVSDLLVAINRQPKSESRDKIAAKVSALQDDRRFEFLVRPDASVEDNLPALMGQLLRLPCGAKPLTIVDLSGVPSDVVDVVVSVLCRAVFDFAVWNPDRCGAPVLLVCEEAHRYIPKGEEAAFRPAKRALSRIAKEGRKYGVGLALVTQRPSDLAEEAVSQCNTIVALRMSNEHDQEFVRRVLPDSVRSMVDALPSLKAREALVVGEGVTVPVRMVFDFLAENLRPNSQDAPFAEAWSQESPGADMVAEVVRRWRMQER